MNDIENNCGKELM